MFDNIGKDLDEEANKRRAASLGITVFGLAAITGITVGITAWTAAEVLLDTDLEAEMVELLEEAIDELAPPPPPPPPPPPAAAPDEEEEEEVTEPEPDEMVEEVEELKEEVKEEIKSDIKPQGVEGGKEGGVEGGQVGGVDGGIVGGELGGKLGGVRVFHHSELEVKKRVNPRYPESAKSLQLGDQRCLVKVFIDEKGIPFDAVVEKCPKVFHAGTKEAILRWRWYPPKDGKNKIKAQTTIAVTYKLN